MGQMIWRANFLGRELTMKSIHDEPLPAKSVFGEIYGCFLMHCGLTAMGMVLPATAEHKGYLYCKERGYEKYLQTGESVTYHIRTGFLDKPKADALHEKIKIGTHV